MASKRTYRTADQWQSIIRDFEQSDLTAKSFCRSRNLGYPSFSAWRRRLSSEEQSERPAQSTFIELTSSPASSTHEHVPMPIASQVNSPETPTIVELSLGGGVQLRITRGV